MNTAPHSPALLPGSPRPILSVLTATVPSRWEQAGALARKLEGQIRSSGFNVEHLILCDNRRRTIGEKRDALLRAARGEYVAWVDDDDDVAENYVAALVNAAVAVPAPDVITFRQHCVVNGQEGMVEFHLGSENEPWRPGVITRRNAWHVCAWRRKLAILAFFPPLNYDEDTHYCAMLWRIQGIRETHIHEVLHFYRHDASRTLSDHPYLRAGVSTSSEQAAPSPAGNAVA